MAELNHTLHLGRMNKDLDERLIPNGEYRDAMNVEVATSEGSNLGTLQTLRGNINLSNFITGDLYCVGSVVDEQNDRIYWMISGVGKDIIAEYDYKTKAITPVVVDIFPMGTPIGSDNRALEFDKAYLITGINIIDNMLFWTDNNTEPKRVHIERCKMGSTDFSTQTNLYIRDVILGPIPNINSGDNYIDSGKPLRRENITVIKKSPPSAPFLEMKTTTREDLDGDNSVEIATTISHEGNPFGDDYAYIITDITTTPSQNINNYPILDESVDFQTGDNIILTTSGDGKTFEIRAKILGFFSGPMFNIPDFMSIEIISSEKNIFNEFGIWDIKLELPDPLFKFKFPRFATRYKYEDGEYSTFSPFTEPAFLPGDFSYLPKESYNLGMVNNIRYLAIKDFVDRRLIPDDVISIDILYKESNSPNVYTVKTIKRGKNTSNNGWWPNADKTWDEWNAISKSEVLPSGSNQKVHGFLEITSELIHATLPSNQLLRPYDNVPRKALAQEITGNRIVYGNYLQNYDLKAEKGMQSTALAYNQNFGALQAQDNIKIDLDLKLKVGNVGDVLPAQYNPLFAGTEASPTSYGPAKSIKTLRTYQVGVVYIDEFGRETPVFSDALNSENSITLKKNNAVNANKLAVQPRHIAPDFAKSYKFFIKETSNEYYNLAMDRWYNAEDGNIWLTFPSAERNKVDLETFLILKKEHSTNEPVAATVPSTMANEFVAESARYKIIAIENEAPLFVKTKLKPAGSIQDDGTIIGSTNTNFPLPDNFQVRFAKLPFEQAGFATTSTSTQFPGQVIAGTEGSLFLQDYSKFKMRAKVPGSNDGNTVSNWYDIENVTFSSAANGSYIVTFTEKFKHDMSITSMSSGPDAFTDRLSNVVMELGVKDVENKPEFDGRFFVKIKKDAVIQDRIMKESDPGDSEYSVLNAMQCQYISPHDAEQTLTNPNECYDINDPIVTDGNHNYFANFYGSTPMQGPAGAFGAGYPKHYLLSTANQDSSAFGIGDNNGYSETFWRKASYGDNDVSGAYHTTNNPNGRRSQSSGWFIDKIEGFRRTKAAWKNYGKIKPNDPGGDDWTGYGTHHEGNLYDYNYQQLFGSGSSGAQVDGSVWYNTANAGPFGPSNQMQLEGTCTMGSKGNTWNNYLDLTGAKGPHNTLLYDYTLSGGDIYNKGTGFNFVHPRNEAPAPHTFLQDNAIIPSQGINENVIHLSYSGIGNIEHGTGTSGKQYNDTSNNFFEYSIDVAQNHVVDIEFINAITTPGTIWRWKEDPGKCLYQTQRYSPGNDNSYVMGDYDYPVAGASGATPLVPGGIPHVKPGDNDGYGQDKRNSLRYLNYSAVVQDHGLWNYNTFDHAEGQNQLGVGLYNIASFLDYPVDNPTQTGVGSLIGGYDYSNLSPAMICGLKWCSGIRTVYTAASNPPEYQRTLYCAPWSCVGLYTGWTHNKKPTANNSTYHNMGPGVPHYAWTGSGFDPCGKWPMMTRDWNKPFNKRRRFQFIAKALEEDPSTGERYNLGEAPAHNNAQNPGHQHFYLPTNDPILPPHFASNNQVLDLTTSIGNDNAGNAYPTLPNTPAPGVRRDGMHSGYPLPGNSYSMDTGGETNKTFYTIPYLRTEDGSSRQSQVPGSFTWEILTQTSTWNDKQISSSNPAIWETEPKEDIGLDIYHEVGQIYPIELNENNSEQFLGPIKDIPIENSKVTCKNPSTGLPKILDNGGNNDIRVRSVANVVGNPITQTFITLQDSSGAQLSTITPGAVIPAVNDILFFTRADGSVTSTKVLVLLPFGLGYGLAEDLHNYEVTLPFHNCYSFGNGVESDRIRDDFNQVTIDNGPKASTTLEEPYKEERRGSGLIYSGIYNSMSGVNNLNQFVAAEKITKDLNPKYGTIQKLHTRNTNLLTLCEDKVFKILANKDALYNADGSMNLVATENVLGQATPMLGEYGISTNPESFASESYRTYFTDRVRGAVIRLSQDGVTAISDVGMKDYFGDTLPQATRIIGSVDDRKEEYNISVNYFDYNTYPVRILGASKTGVAPFTPLFKLIVIGLKAYNAFKTNAIITGPGIPLNTKVNSKTNLGGGEYEIIISNSPSQQDVANLPGPNPYSAAGVVSWDTIVSVSQVKEELPNYTVSFSEPSKGWVSFKSWIHENGVSLNNEYYTFNGGDLYQHHVEDVPRNTFYDNHVESSVQVLFNENPSNVKSFQTLNYEGTQSRITEDFQDNQYWDNKEKFGWYVDNIYTDLQEGKIHEFKEKEGKWFSQVQGEATEWLDDLTGGNIDTSEFSYQGIDEAGDLHVISGGFTSWDCISQPYNPPSQACSTNLAKDVNNNTYIHYDAAAAAAAGNPSLQNPSWINYILLNHNGNGSYGDILIYAGNPLAVYHGVNPYISMASPTMQYPCYVNGVDNTQGHYVLLGLPFSTASDPQQSDINMLHGLTLNPLYHSNGMDIFQALENRLIVWDLEYDANGNSIFPPDVESLRDIAIAAGSPMTFTVQGNCSCPPANPPINNCIEIQGSGGAYIDEPTCLADVNSPCAPIPETYNCDNGSCIDPMDGSGQYTGPNALIDCQAACTACSSVPLSINSIDATSTAAGSPNCNPDGQVEVGASTTGPTWTLEIFTQTGTLVYTDPNIYASGTTSNAYTLLPPNSYTAEVTDSFGCVSIDTFIIGCNSVNNQCVTTGPYGSFQGASTSPHHFTHAITPPTGPGCNNGAFIITNQVLGNNGQSTPTTWTVELLQGLLNPTVIATNTTPQNLGDSVSFSNLSPGFYRYRITDNDGCIYAFGAYMGGCSSPCTSNMTSQIQIPGGAPAPIGTAPWPAGSCANWDSDLSAFYGHIGNGTVLKPICTDRCDNGNPDNTVLDSGMYSFQIGCFPTDVHSVKVEYYASKPGSGHACTFIEHALLGFATPYNLIYSDPNIYTENMDNNPAGAPPTTTIIWDDVTPNSKQMDCGPKDGGAWNMPDEYVFFALIKCYDASGNLILDGNGNTCAVRTKSFDVPCNCGPTNGGSGWNCTPFTSQCVPHPGPGMGTYSSQWACLNGQGNNPACQPVLNIPGCMDPTANNYNSAATTDCLGDPIPNANGAYGETASCCTYTPICPGTYVGKYDANFSDAASVNYSFTGVADTTAWSTLNPPGLPSNTHWQKSMDNAMQTVGFPTNNYYDNSWGVPPTGYNLPGAGEWKWWTSNNDPTGVITIPQPGFNQAGELVLSGPDQNGNQVTSGIWMELPQYMFQGNNPSTWQMIISFGNNSTAGTEGWFDPTNAEAGTLIVGYGSGSVSTQQPPISYNSLNYNSVYSGSAFEIMSGSTTNNVPTGSFGNWFGPISINPQQSQRMFLSVGIKSTCQQSLTIKKICITCFQNCS